jgi:hypothetical protein
MCLGKWWIVSPPCPPDFSLATRASCVYFMSPKFILSPSSAGMEGMR